MNYLVVLALVAILAVATTNAGGCATTEGQYAKNLRWKEPRSTATQSKTTTSDPGKACMTYAEVTQ